MIKKYRDVKGSGGVERDLRLRLRADVSVDDDECRLLECRAVFMRDTRSLLTAHSLSGVCACVCASYSHSSGEYNVEMSHVSHGSNLD